MIRWSTLNRTRLGQFFGSCRTHKVPKTFIKKFYNEEILPCSTCYQGLFYAQSTNIDWGFRFLFCFAKVWEKKRQSIMANFDFHLNPPSPTLKKYSMSQKVMLGKIGWFGTYDKSCLPPIHFIVYNEWCLLFFSLEMPFEEPLPNAQNWKKGKTILFWIMLLGEREKHLQ